MIGEIDKAQPLAIPPDIGHLDVRGANACLLSCVLQVAHRQAVFIGAGVGKINRTGGVVLQVFPFRDEFLVQRVELVGVGKAVLKPVPLGHGRFDQAGRRVGVILQQLDCCSVVGQVEPAIERGRLVVPGCPDRRAGGRGDSHLAQPVLIQDYISGG